MVLQGSNNTLICLGQNRGWTKKDEEFETTNAFYEEELLDSGAIDIVVGRGRYKPDNPATDAEDGDEPVRTATRTMTNANEGQIESNRMAILNEVELNVIEGDPDYEYDAARFNLAMKASYDEQFFINKSCQFC